MHASFDPERGSAPFSFYVPASLTKSYETPDGKAWVVEGPLSDPGADLQQEEMDVAGLKKGLETFTRLQMPVDWDHLWERTREPKWLIGKGVTLYDRDHPVTGNKVPWLRTELAKSKDVARQAMEHLEAGLPLGYSVAGRVAAGGRDGNRILQPIVTSVALTPVPVVDANAGCIQLVKSLSAYRHGAELRDLQFPTVPELLEITEPVLRKALEVSGALPRTGPGPDALGTEDLDGAKGGKRPKRRKGKAAPVDPACAALHKALGHELARILRQARASALAADWER
jgi:hypothetical protein